MAVKNSVSDIPADFKSTLPPRKRARTQEEKEQRRIERILRNRRAAHQSREKKRMHVQQLEDKCQLLEDILTRIDVDVLSREDAKLGEMVSQWRQLDAEGLCVKMETPASPSGFAYSPRSVALDSPQSLTSSPGQKTGCATSCAPAASSASSSAPSPASAKANLLPSEYNFDQQVLASMADDSIFVDENIEETGDSNYNVASDGWNLLLTVPPELTPDFSSSESTEMVDPLGLDTWRNPAVIVT